MKKLFFRTFALACAMSCLITSVCATEANLTSYSESTPDSSIVVLATGSFTTTLNAKEKAKIGGSLPLAAGETVTIRATYTPANSSLDFGLLDENNAFHYLNTTTGRIDKTFKIEENGNYTVVIRNNSNTSVKITGFVEY